MERRRITLGDGRYMIFYTFDDEPPARIQPAATSAERSEKEHQPEAEPLKETPRV